MITFKCKMCGGDLHPVENATTCECDFCGSVQTIPTADSEKKMNLFNRAQRLLRACEFDKAAGVYESIVAEFPEEAEAYWGLVLCKYGIEYVDDPNTGKKIPTCHRSSFDSVMDDTNFEQATENADSIARRVYREEAKAIEELRKGIIDVSSKEEPYDIFICYKETDENGNRTLDSVLAQDIYDALTEKGYKVFFARITLEDKLGQEYEPYIFAALNSAKVMLVIGTDYEYFNAVWVKNEWSRFLKLIASGERKTLIPCYKNIDAYDMPKEFTKLQSQDIGKIGALQDLIRGIQKILEPQKEKTTVQTEAEIKEQKQINNYLEMANDAFISGRFPECDSYCNKVMELDVRNHHAWFIRGKSIGWQSSTKNNRFPDSIKAFANAINYASEGMKDEVAQDTIKELTKLLIALFIAKCEEFCSSPKDEEAEAFSEVIQLIQVTVPLFKQQTSYDLDMDRIVKECGDALHEKITSYSNEVFRRLRNTFDGKSSGASEELWNIFRSYLINYLKSLEYTLVLFNNDEHQNSIKLLGDAIYIGRGLLDFKGRMRVFDPRIAMMSYEEKQALFAQARQMDVIIDLQAASYAYKIELDDNTRKLLRQRVESYEERKNKVLQKEERRRAEERIKKEREEKAIAEKRFNDYWNSHSSEKEILLKEKNDTSDQLMLVTRKHELRISELNQDLRKATDDKEIKELETQIQQLTNRLSSLGIFKGREKKDLQAQIDQTRNKKHLVSDKMAVAKASIQKEIDAENREYEGKTIPLRSRLKEIDHELNRPR